MNVELLSPAGDFETALAAFDAGADAVYCGLSDYSARAFAKNFTADDLKKLMRVARARGKRVYVTVNTVIDEADVEGVVRNLSDLAAIGPSALIVQDLGVARLCRTYFPELELHASTQLVAHNLEGVLALKELGFTRAVLARELSAEEIASIAKRCGGMELEAFIHGALCYSISGLCLFSAMEKDRSGNRGKCAYCCRQSYEDEAGRKTLAFSMKDLRLGGDVKKLVDAGVCSLKIEGRMKSALYVASVTKYYRQILDAGRPEVGPYLKDGRARAPREPHPVTLSDLETVFSRRTTELYLNGRSDSKIQRFEDSPIRPFVHSPIDPISLGHLGTPIGTVKRVTKDREGLSWLRFHTSRALEKHDGLQFAAPDGGKPFGFGITLMRQTLSRAPVFEVAAGTDVEILLPSPSRAGVSPARAGTGAGETPALRGEGVAGDFASIRPGDTVYCSMSNAVKRMFPPASYRPSDYPGTVKVDLTVTLAKDGLAVQAVEQASSPAQLRNFKNPHSEEAGTPPLRGAASVTGTFTAAKSPDKTFGAVEKAFSKLGETDYCLGKLTVNDPDRLFAPMSALNDLRRDLVEALDDARAKAQRAQLERALADDACGLGAGGGHGVTPRIEPASQLASLGGYALPSLEAEELGVVGRSLRERRRLKLRAGQKLPQGDWSEIIVAINGDTTVEQASSPAQLRDLNNPHPEEAGTPPLQNVRLALPVYTAEPEFNKLRVAVKRFLRAGYQKWEAADLATLRMLKELGVTDITADWTCYAFNASALKVWSDLGVKRFVASPENNRENLQFLAESGYAVEFLAQQSTPLFVSLTPPAAGASASGEATFSSLQNENISLSVFRRDGLWVTTRKLPRTFAVPEGAASRVDLSWDPA